MKIIDYIKNVFIPYKPAAPIQKAYNTVSVNNNRQAKTMTVNDFAGMYSAVSAKHIHAILFGQSIAQRYKLWEYIRVQDAIIHSSMQQRCLALSGKEWDIVTERGIDNAITQNITYALNDIGIAWLTEEVLRSHVGCGMCVLRLEWGELYNMRVPVRVEVVDGSSLERQPRKGGLYAVDELCYVTESGAYSFISDYPLSLIDTNTSDIDLGVLPLCAWNYMLKRYAMRDWQVAAERTGVPPSVFVLPEMPSEAMITDVIHAARNMAQGATGVVPYGTSMLASNISRSDYTALYKALIDAANVEIITGILGQTASTQGTAGSLGNEALRSEVKQNLLDADARFVEGVINRILSLIWFVNYGSYSGAPVFKFSTASARDTASLATVIQTLVTAGLEIPASWVYETFDIPKPSNNEETLSAPGLGAAMPVSGALSVTKPKRAIYNRNPVRASAQNVADEYYSKWKQEIPNAPDATLKTFSKLEGVTQESSSKVGDAVRSMLESFDFSNANTSLDIGQVKSVISSIIQDALAESYLVGAQRFADDAVSGMKRYGRNGNIKATDVAVTDDIYLELRNSLEGLPMTISDVYALDDPKLRELILSVTDTIASGVADRAQSQYFDLINNAIVSGITREDFSRFISDVVTVTEHHAETIFRTAGASVLQHARSESEKTASDIIWGYEYIAVMDSRTRPNHAALDGFKAQKEHPFWKQGFPPNGYNCRCDYSTIFNFEADKVTNSMFAEIPEGAGIDPGFAGNPMDTLIAHIQGR